MNRSDRSYLVTVIFFAAGFLGFTLLPEMHLFPVWYAALGIGILLFLIRIITGDD